MKEKVLCITGESCPDGLLEDAVLREDGSAILAYTTDRVVVLDNSGTASTIQEDSSDIATASKDYSAIPTSFSRIVGTVDTANAVVLGGSRRLVFGRSHRKRPLSTAIGWPRFTQEGSVGGLAVAALVVPPGRSATDSVLASVQLLSAAHSTWTVHTKFRVPPRSVIGSRFAVFPGLFQTTNKWAVDAGGNIWIGDPLKPQVERYDARTGKVAIVAWDGPLAPVTQREVDSIRARLYKSEKGAPSALMALAMHAHTDSLLRNIPPTHPAIVAIVAASDTTLWIRKTHVSGDPYDEWVHLSDDGRILDTVRIPASVRFLDARREDILVATEIGRQTNIMVYRLARG